MAYAPVYRCPNCGTHISKGLEEAIKDPEREERCPKTRR